MTQAAEAVGVSIECGCDVTELHLTAGRVSSVQCTAGAIATDVVVNCAGAWAPPLAAPLAVNLPIRGRRVQLMLARPGQPLPFDLPWVIDPVAQIHIRSDVDGLAQLGGFLFRDETVDPSAFDHDADAEWMATVLQRTEQRFGILVERSSIVDSWAGLYPTTPDQHPIVDRTDPGMIVVGGFAGAGLMHAPAAGLVAAELIVDGKISSIDADSVSLSRFSRPMEAVERTGF
jgi:glycine/D-amino acid oxidase-like deaminating enzyme